MVLRTKPAKVAQFVRDLAPAYVPGARSLRHVSSHVTEATAVLRYREKVRLNFGWNGLFSPYWRMWMSASLDSGR